MYEGSLHLRPDVVLEPLVNRWYAWPHLVSPMTAPAHVGHQLRIMKSFVANPGVHASALRNPAMRGGPFLDAPVERVPEIRDLLEKTEREEAARLGFSAAARRFAEELSARASGESLLPLYDELPDELKGYVELVYDAANRPSVRVLEGLLYRSPHHRRDAQSVTLSLAGEDGARPFVFSTPRLPAEGRLELPLAFDDPRLDVLLRAADEPRPLAELARRLELDEAKTELLATLLTPEAPAPRARFGGAGVRVRYFGHACVLVESRETTLLTDPVVSYAVAGGVPRYTLADLPDVIDHVLITHAHQDHCMLETLLRLRHRIRNVIVPKTGTGGADPSLKLVLKSAGFRNVVEIDEMEEIEVAGGSITGLPFLGEHGDLDVRGKTAYLVRVAGRSLFFGADSNAISPDLYDHVHDACGDVDVCFLGMECDGAPMSWMYGPLVAAPLTRKMDQSRRLDGSDAARALALVTRLRPSAVYVYAMGAEPWLSYVTSIRYTETSRPIVESDRLVAELRARGLASERLFGQKELHLPAAASRGAAA